MIMALSNNVLLIRDYENIRNILRDIYLYGCFSRDDFIEKGISGRKYDNEQRRINAYLPKHFIKKRRVNKKVLHYCSYKIADSSHNYLADTYRNKSFTALDIMAYFFVQQILYKKAGLTLAELLAEIPNLNKNVLFTKDNLYVKLEELCEKGYIFSQKEGRNVLYFLNEDIWNTFSDEELFDILIYLEFLKNTSPIEMPYYFLYRKLKLYLLCDRKMNLADVQVFQFKHNHTFNSLDNDILLDILRAIEHKTVLKLVVRTRKGVIESEILPIQIIHDSTYGRQYLICFSNIENRNKVYRIDKIDAIKVVRPFTQEEHTIVCKEKNYEKECWCTSGSNNKLSEIVIQFTYKEKEESYIYKRIIQEGHGGYIEKKKEGVVVYRNKFRDLKEMIPWIRSFGERAKVISSDGVEIEKYIADEWKRAVEKYEAL